MPFPPCEAATETERTNFTADEVAWRQDLEGASGRGDGVGVVHGMVEGSEAWKVGVKCLHDVKAERQH